MTAQVIPLIAQPSQILSVQLGGRSCDIALYQKSTGLFMDLAVNGAQILKAKLCLNGVGLVKYAYLGFVGQLTFIDTEGSSDPTYDGLGARYILVYSS